MFNTKMVYQKCFCCSNNRNINQLVEINSNTITIDDDSINFRDLLLDCCFSKIDSNKPNYICDDCRVQLVTFHMFKRDLKQYRSFADELLKLHVLKDVDVLLDDLRYKKDLQVYKHGNVIIISSPEEALILPDVSNKEEPPENTSIELMNTIKSEPELEMFEENVDHQNSSQVMEEHIKEEESEPTETEFEQETQPVKEEIIIEDCNKIEYSEQSIDMASKRQRYHYKSNTDDKLTDEQRDCKIIRKEVLKSKVLITNDDCIRLNTFVSKEWTKTLRIEHVTSAPNHQQGNGKAEAAVKIEKRLIANAAIGASSNESLSRNTRTPVPSTSEHFRPRIIKNVSERIESRQMKSKEYYERSTKKLPELKASEPVRVQMNPQIDKTFTKGTIQSKDNARDSIKRRIPQAQVQQTPSTSDQVKNVPPNHIMEHVANYDAMPQTNPNPTSIPLTQIVKRKLRNEAERKKPVWHKDFEINID